MDENFILKVINEVIQEFFNADVISTFHHATPLSYHFSFITYDVKRVEVEEASSESEDMSTTEKDSLIRTDRSRIFAGLALTRNWLFHKRRVPLSKKDHLQTKNAERCAFSFFADGRWRHPQPG